MITPGMKVRCINDRPDNGLALPIIEGRTYTVISVKEHPWLGRKTVSLVGVKGRNEFYVERFEAAA